MPSPVRRRPRHSLSTSLPGADFQELGAPMARLWLLRLLVRAGRKLFEHQLQLQLQLQLHRPSQQPHRRVAAVGGRRDVGGRGQGRITAAGRLTARRPQAGRRSVKWAP